MSEKDVPILSEISGYSPNQKTDKLVFVYTRPSLNGKIDAKKDVICITPQELYEILNKQPNRKYFGMSGMI